MKPSRRCEETKKRDTAHLSLWFLLIHPLSISCLFSLLPPRLPLPFLPFTRSYPLSLPRRRSSPLVSLPVSFSRYATTKLLSFLLSFPCSPRPYLVTHKRLACNSPRVYVLYTYRNEPPCFCSVRVIAASCARACRVTRFTYTRMYECTHACIAPGRVSVVDPPRIFSSFHSSYSAHDRHLSTLYRRLAPGTILLGDVNVRIFMRHGGYQVSLSLLPPLPVNLLSP